MSTNSGAVQPLHLGGGDFIYEAFSQKRGSRVVVPP